MVLSFNLWSKFKDMRGFLLTIFTIIISIQIGSSNELITIDTTRSHFMSIEDTMTSEEIANKAMRFREQGNLKKAELYFSKLVYLTDDPMHLLDYAKILKKNGKCKTALFWFKKYAGIKGKDQKSVNKFHFNCNSNSLEANKELSKHIKIKNLTTLNSPDLDFSPTICKSGVLFTSTRQEGKVIKKYDANMGENYTDLYFAQVSKDGEIGEVEKLKGEINGKYHDGVACFNADASRIYFTRNFYEEGAKNAKLSICTATKQDGKWVNVREIELNMKGFSSCHPAVSKDGKRMYFSSNRPGGFGGMDLYVTTKVNGKWSEPINLGININSEKNEIFPSISSYDILYYASNGRNTMGGLDIFMSQKVFNEDERSWMNAYNMGAPFNSTADDFGFVADDSGFKGYFNSDRNKATQDDIFSWEYDQIFANVHQFQINPFTSSIAVINDLFMYPNIAGIEEKAPVLSQKI